MFGSGCILLQTDWFQHWALAQLFGCLTAYLAGIFSHFVNYKLIDSILWISGCYRFCGLCFKFGIQDGIGFIDDYLLTVFLLCEIKWSVFFWLDRVYDRFSFDWTEYMTDQDQVNVARLGHSLCSDKLSYNAYIIYENMLTAVQCLGQFRCGIVMFCCGFWLLQVLRTIG